MAVEMLLGVNVVDEELYIAYRNNMAPILAENGGEFVYDFKIARVMKSATETPINRVFTIRFPDDNAKENFFNDEKYQEVKKEFYVKATDGTTVISTYST